MWDRNPVRLSLLHMLPAVAGDHGLTLDPLLARAGIAAHEGPAAPTVVTRAQICTLLQAVARQTGDPTIGLTLAAAASPQRLGLTGQSLLSGRTLRECLFSHARHMPGLQGGVQFRLQVEGKVATWHHHMLDSDPAHANVLNDGVAGFMTRALRAVAGADAALHVALPHRAPAAQHLYEDALQSAVSFSGGDELALSFDADLLDRPNALWSGAVEPDPAQPGGWQALLPQTEDDDHLVASLHLIFQSAAMSGLLSLADSARTLGYAPRSLQRRLMRLGMTFESLLDSWRQAQALQYLAHTHCSVGEVALALGYSHPAHFVRAFRRWQAMTPLAFRRSVRMRMS